MEDKIGDYIKDVEEITKPKQDILDVQYKFIIENDINILKEFKNNRYVEIGEYDKFQKKYRFHRIKYTKD